MRSRHLVPPILFALAGPVLGATVTERGLIDSVLTVPSVIMSRVGTLLPESSNVAATFLSPTYQPNLVISEPAQVRVTFLSEGAGYRNTLGYFTFHHDGAAVVIDSRGLVFPNASFANPNLGWGGGQLATGDTVTLRDATGAPRTFAPGEQVGFFLIADGWNGSAVRGWNNDVPNWPTSSPVTNATNRVLTTLDELNPEYGVGLPGSARHVAMVQMAGVEGFLGGADVIVLGFEDIRRDQGSDNDFNDCVFVVHATPETAIASTDIPRYDPVNPDPDGDGVSGLADYFPNDPTRATIARIPASSYYTFGFEDNYPNLGDRDYNDAVIQVAYEQVLDSTGRMVDLYATFHLVARGAGYDSAFGLALHGLSPTTTGTIEMERFSSDGVETRAAPRPLMLGVDAAGAAMLRIDDIFPSTRQALPPAPGHAYSNTEGVLPETSPASVRVAIHFASPMATSAIGTAPYDPYLLVDHAGVPYDVHQAGVAGFPGRPAELPVESGPSAYLDQNGTPWVLLVSYDWRFPLEKKPIDGTTAAYPEFDTWRASAGVQQVTWFKFPYTGGAARVVAPVANASRSRAWTLEPTGAGTGQ